MISGGFHELIEPVLAREGVELERRSRTGSTPAGRLGRPLPRRDACAICGEPCKRGSLAREPYVYVGDGYSDRCAALAADRVFARDSLRHLDSRVAYEPFDDLHDVASALT